MKEWGPLSLSTYIEVKSGNHLQNIRYFQISEQLAYKATDNLDLELHYSYIRGNSVVPNAIWNWQHRLELEANPTFHLFGKSYIDTRNRVEIRKIEHTPPIQYRFRQRTMLVFPIDECGPLKSYKLYNEIFYNISTHMVSQDRVCPINLTFTLTKKIDMDVFFMFRFFISDNIWRRSATLGTQIKF